MSIGLDLGDVIQEERVPTGFEYRRIATTGATINVAIRGKGAPLLLLHGYPETHHMWHKVAPALTEDFAVACAALRGYGDSSKPEGTPDHANDSKRAFFHWYFLIQPRPLPGTLIGNDPAFWLNYVFRKLSPDPTVFSDATIAEYLRSVGTPEGVHATCEDYRAGATIDLANDRADVSAGRKITCPTLILWGARSVVGKLFRPLEKWRDLVASPEGEAIDCGHFIPEEQPDETLRALRALFQS